MPACLSRQSNVFLLAFLTALALVTALALGKHFLPYWSTLDERFRERKVQYARKVGSD